MMHLRTGNRNRAPIYDEINELPISSGALTPSLQQPNRSDDAFWEFPRNRINLLRKLGEGSFGSVNKAKILPLHSMTLIHGGIVAVKTLKGKSMITEMLLNFIFILFVNFVTENTTVKDRKDFLNELNLMKKLEPHSHVVQLLGCCTLSGIGPGLMTTILYNISHL